MLMKTFFNILQTLVGIKNKSYPDEEFKILEKIDVNDFENDKLTINFMIGTIYFGIQKCNKSNIFSKNAYCKIKSLNGVYENIHYTNEFKEHISNIFINAQRHYNAFSRFVRIYKLRKNPYVVTDDLSLNPLDKNHKLTFILVENKSNFLFNINELVTIIENSISNSPNFFSEPLWPLNPYNNQPFTTASLYNIYFQLKNTSRLMPMLFHSFFLENFDLNNFSENYEPLIRESSIKKYIFNSPYTVLYSSVISMLKHNTYTDKLCIHTDFPKELLVEIFRPFLFYDYIANYYIRGTSKVYNAKILLNKKLKQFYNYNKMFGRQIIKLTKNNNNKIVKREMSFNTEHISFYNIEVNSSPNTDRIFFRDNILAVVEHIYNLNSSDDDIETVNNTINNENDNDNDNNESNDNENNNENDNNENNNESDDENDNNESDDDETLEQDSIS